MRRATVVIGSQFGDEGKGLATDWLAAREADSLVVRFNGGAQAGHTVVAPDGRRHVFSHFGSGTFAGAPTFLSRYFVANPTLFLDEANRLSALGCRPEVMIDPACPVTTPFDMVINQAAEIARGAGRHGSCGVGFGETIERCLHPAYSLTIADLADRDALARRLEAIRTEWVPTRLARLGIDAIQDRCKPLLETNFVAKRWLDDVTRFRSQVREASLVDAAAARGLVFEGAQGLLLDQDMGCFPHVTRSHTGLRTAAALAEELGLDGLDVIYMSRCYLTRHGAGPLAGELARPPFAGFADETNRPHPFQGRLRFAYLDVDALARQIEADLVHSGARLAVRRTVGVTCLDQIAGAAVWIEGGREVRGAEADLVTAVERATGLEVSIESWGPRRADVLGTRRDRLAA
ncbi:MAG TPA: adenylosuccinate synthetase [Microvirga sp.]|nr:adenylosuccinate synthetase [Microvirga sp.]